PPTDTANTQTAMRFIPPPSKRQNRDTFFISPELQCAWALHKKSWAVIDRPYSLGCTTVGALYERPRCIFCAKPCARHNNRLLVSGQVSTVLVTRNQSLARPCAKYQREFLIWSDLSPMRNTSFLIWVWLPLIRNDQFLIWGELIPMRNSSFLIWVWLPLMRKSRYLIGV